MFEQYHLCEGRQSEQPHWEFVGRGRRALGLLILQAKLSALQGEIQTAKGGSALTQCALHAIIQVCLLGKSFDLRSLSDDWCGGAGWRP